MAIGNSLNINAVSNQALDSWQLNLAAANVSDIDLTEYENYIQNSITSFVNNGPSNLYDGEAIIPIVFHLILDSYNIVSPSGQSFDFDVAKIIEDLNTTYSALNITFAPVIHNLGSGNMEELGIPGVHIVDAMNLRDSRRVPGTETINRLYTEEGITVTGSYFDRSTNVNPIADIGFSLNKLYTDYSWGNQNVLNIFLINSFTFNTKIIVDAPNPYVFDNLNGSTYNITLPFYALGNPWQSEEFPGYGYRYTVETPIQNQVKTLIHSDSHNIYSYFGSKNHMVKPLVKAIGHALGLAPLNSFNYSIVEQGDSIENSCNQNCVYNRFIGSDFCYSCDYDAVVSKFPDIEKPFVSTVCDFLYDIQDSEFINPMSYKISTTIMHHYTFTLMQQLRVKANIGLSYIEDDGSLNAGILTKLINSNVVVSLPEPSLEEQCDQKDRKATISNNNRTMIYNQLSFKEDKNIKEFSRKVKSIATISNKIYNE